MIKLKNFIFSKRKNVIVFLAIIGALMIILSFAIDSSEKTSKKNSDNNELSEYGNTLEEKLENTLSALTGEGSIEAMITFSTGFENVYDNGISVSNGYDSMFSTSGAASEPVQIKRNCPKIGGVMLVCDAGLDEESLLQIKKAAATALNISETKIYVIGGETRYGKNR